jgi:hypothetical protein
VGEWIDNPVIVHCIELDGNVYPPLIEACMNCSYAKTSVHFAEDEAIVCGVREQYVDMFDWCPGFDLNELAIPDELEEYLDEHPELFYEDRDDVLLPGDE